MSTDDPQRLIDSFLALPAPEDPTLHALHLAILLEDTTDLRLDDSQIGSGTTELAALVGAQIPRET